MVTIHIQRDGLFQFVFERKRKGLVRLEHRGILMQRLHTQRVFALDKVHRLRVHVTECHRGLVHIDQLRKKRRCGVVYVATERRLPCP